jgi:hypothetical protein
MALGLVITAMSFTGIFAVFTDRATTGTNHVDSGTQARVVDIQLATSANGDCTDAVFSEDLATGIIDVSDIQPGDGPQVQYLCLRNVGTAHVTYSVSAIDLTDTETGCTGDEAEVGDPTCGTAGAGDGELGDVLIANVVPIDCDTQDIAGIVIAQTLSTLDETPVELTGGSAGEVVCLRVAATMPQAGGDVTSDALQLAQSDQVEWRYAFDASPS